MRRANTHREIPPPLELECLKVLWRSGEANVKQVQECLAAVRPLAYTTVMTVLDRLTRKGLTVRRKQGRSFLYAPAVEQETIREHALRQLLENFFDGSTEQLRSYLNGDRRAAPEESPRAAVQEDGQQSAPDRIDAALL